MKDKEFLNLDKNFDQTKDKDSEFKHPTFESKRQNIDWEKDIYNQPRALTIKNIRDIFFSLLNQSQTQQRVCDTEDNIRRLWVKCS